MKKVLIVDDEPLMLKLAEHALKVKYEPVLASSGDEAVKLYSREAPDLILSDIKMPGMSGYELQSTIRSKFDDMVPFVFMTADESDDSEKKGLEYGAADYIRKPIKAELLLKRIERVFETVEEHHRLKMAARTDAMTGLYNKVATEEILEDECTKKAGMLLVIDLDNFKLVNDIYGHEMGDKILIRFSSLIKAVIRDDDIAGRIGGDEFVIFCEGLKQEEVVKKRTEYLNTEIMKAAIEFMGEDMDIPLGCSIGAVYTKGKGDGYSKLFPKGDEALYKVKQSGKHGFAFYDKEHKENEDQDVDDKRNLQMIFGERQIVKGANVVDVDEFRHIYRFLVRVTKNYPWNIRLAVFSFTVPDGMDEDAVTDAFMEICAPRLRSSDTVLKYNARQVLVMLLKVVEDDFAIPVARVLKAWDEDGISGVTVDCRSERVGMDAALW